MCCIIHGSASTFAHTHKARSAKRLAHANVRVLLRAQRCKRWEKVSSHPIELLWLQYSRVKWLLKNKRCPFATNKWFLVMPFWQLFPFDERNNTHFGSYWGTFKFFEANRLPFCTGIFAIFLACSSTVPFCALILPRVLNFRNNHRTEFAFASKNLKNIKIIPQTRHRTRRINNLRKPRRCKPFLRLRQMPGIIAINLLSLNTPLRRLGVYIHIWRRSQPVALLWLMAQNAQTKIDFSETWSPVWRRNETRKENNFNAFQDNLVKQ